MMSLTSIKRLPVLALLAVATLLTACADAPKGPSYPQVRFTDKPAISFSASSVDISSTYRAPLREPNVDHLFPVSLESTARNWASDRLNAAGGPNRLRYIVTDASAIEEKLDTTKGIKGAFTTDQSERYTAQISVRLEVINSHGNVVGEAEVTVKRSHTVAEDYTVNQRNQIWYDMNRDLGADLNEKLEAEIVKSLSPYRI
jgi:hypothetical protein